jgi:protease-4
LVPNLEAFHEKYGLSFHLITASDRKNLLNPGSKMTAEDREILAKQVRSTYETFVNRVASGRKRTFAEIDAIGQGRVWTGEQAKAFGLVDELGGLPEAFRSAKELAKLDLQKEYPILHYEEPGRSFGQCLRKGRIWSCFSMDGLTKSHIPGLDLVPGVHAIARWVNGVPKEKVLTLLLQRVEVK